ncbi:hypothetical protein CYPRO_0682 [Cyclonatronum proteinivorum]|uniref:Uncharacterized protein n=1 Tax=Cyclonatronum proteinivorum TaxID=1457365 RepID=A0A345UHL4_9BACT|nr:hypothetical protein [Cyclonatronum proteinivorum]AXI99965.1 hypothetical protein CYPRO_0682 [Cyclonatronum proteinivorum]
MSAPLQIPITSSANLLIRTDTPHGLFEAVRQNTPVSETDWEAGEMFSIGLSSEGGEANAHTGADGGADGSPTPLSVHIPAGEGRSLSFGMQASKGLSLRRDFSSAIETLSRGQEIAAGLHNPNPAQAHHFLMLHWNYDVRAAHEGTLPLGAGKSAVYGVEAGRERLFALIRAVEPQTGTRDALQTMLRNWMMPRAVRQASDLDPGTWLVTELDRSVTAKIGCQMGYDFSWVHELGEGGLAGDIGLKLESAMKATVGFDFSGKFALVVARESADPSNQQLRVRLFKLRKKGWDFALSATAQAESSAEFREADIEELLKAILGIQSVQVLSDLKSVKTWMGDNSDLASYFAELSADSIRDFLGGVTGLDVVASVDEASGQLNAWFKKWDRLTQETAASLWQLAEDGLPLDEIRDLSRTISEADEDKIRTFLIEKCSKPDFLTSGTGKFLLSLVPGEDLFGALLRTNSIRQIREAAKKVHHLLDGDVSERILLNLNRAINRRLNLENIREVLTETDFEQLDEWLKARLARFFGKKLEDLGLEDLRNLKQFIERWEAKKGRILEKMQEVVTHQYGAAFNYAYSKSRSHEALIDLSIDFSYPDEAGRVLQMAMDGNFDRLLTETFESVTLHQAVLTHGIMRSASVQFSLPFAKRDISAITESVATAEAFDTEDGRLLLYQLDTKSRLKHLGKSAGLMTIGGYFQSQANQVRTHSRGSIDFSYTLRQAHKSMQADTLKLTLKPVLKQYFPEVGTVWVNDLDKIIDELEANETGNLGSLLQSLHVHVPGEIGVRWLHAPSKIRDYQPMADHLMQTMRKTFFSYYLNRLSANTHDKNTADALLLYSSVPEGFFPGKRGKRLHWYVGKRYHSGLGVRDFDKKSIRAAMLIRLLEMSHAIGTLPDLEDRFGKYIPRPENTTRILNDVFNSPSAEEFLNNLFWTEQQIIDGAAAAGRKLNKALKKSASKPQKAVKAFAAFGDSLAKAFDGRQLKRVFGEAHLSASGALLFAAAAEAFPEKALTKLQGNTRMSDTGEATPPQHIRSLLALYFLRPESQHDFNTFLKSGKVPAEEVLLSPMLVSGEG